MSAHQQAHKRRRDAAYERGYADALEQAASYIEGADGKLPGANVFVTLVSGNNQPCMSGDGRDRLVSNKRRAFDDAASSLALEIRNLRSAG